MTERESITYEARYVGAKITANLLKAFCALWLIAGIFVLFRTDSTYSNNGSSGLSLLIVLQSKPQRHSLELRYLHSWLTFSICCAEFGKNRRGKRLSLAVPGRNLPAKLGLLFNSLTLQSETLETHFWNLLNCISSFDNPRSRI